MCFSAENLQGSVVKLSDCRLFIMIAYSYVEGEDMLYGVKLKPYYG